MPALLVGPPTKLPADPREKHCTAASTKGCCLDAEIHLFIELLALLLRRLLGLAARLQVTAASYVVHMIAGYIGSPLSGNGTSAHEAHRAHSCSSTCDRGYR